MGARRGFAPPFGPPPAASSPLASPFGDFGTCTFPTTPARYARALALGLANPSRDGAPRAALARPSAKARWVGRVGGPSRRPAGSPRDYPAQRTRRPVSSSKNLAVVSMLFSNDSTMSVIKPSFSWRRTS